MTPCTWALWLVGAHSSWIGSSRSSDLSENSSYKTCFCKRGLILIWLFLFLLSLPNMILSNKEATPSSVKKCTSLKGPSGAEMACSSELHFPVHLLTVFVLMLSSYVIAKKVYDSYRKSKSKDSKNNKRLEGKSVCCRGCFLCVLLRFISPESHILTVKPTVRLIADCKINCF